LGKNNGFDVRYLLSEGDGIQKFGILGKQLLQPGELDVKVFVAAIRKIKR
jgi:hypothetical protein